MFFLYVFQSYPLLVSACGLRSVNFIKAHNSSPAPASKTQQTKRHLLNCEKKKQPQVERLF